MQRVLWVVGPLVVLGCGGSSSEPSTPADVASDSASLGDTIDDAGADATTDAASDTSSGTDTASSSDTTGTADTLGTDSADALADPLATLSACLGTSAPLTVSRQMPYTNVAVGSSSGAFLVDLATTFSLIDLGAFAAPKPTTHGCDPTKLGQTCTVDGFAFFASPGSVTLVTADFSGGGGTVRQAGIIGTDFTSLKIITLSYGGGRIHASGKSGFCSDASLGTAGFGALPTAGFYSNDLSTLKPMYSVDAAASGGHVPNVPTVPMKIGGAAAVAQLDTGFDDALVHFSVNVNPAYLSAIQASDPGALVRDSTHDLTLSTCIIGTSEKVQAYKLASGRTLDFLDASGAAVRKVAGATVFVKTSSPKTCGGIGTWTVPAAQVAGSFFVDMGAMIFDPYSSRVWVPR